MKLLKLFKKKKVDEEEAFLQKQLKKLPRKRRKKAKVRYCLAKKGYILRVGEDVDNKEILRPGMEYYNGQIF